MSRKNKIYFASDFHLGLKGNSDPAARERHVVAWLDSVAPNAAEIYLVGDVFDFWWEYRHVVPKGFVRFLGKIAEISDAGTTVHFFPGNHDIWMGTYLRDECGLIMHAGPETLIINGKRIHIAHGEGLGKDSRTYSILLWIFRNRLIRRFYSALHPRIGVGLALRWSLNSRLAKNYSREFRGPDNEPLFTYARNLPGNGDIDYFVFGHRHIALDHPLGDKGRLFILGNWFSQPAYLELGENGEASLISFPYH